MDLTDAEWIVRTEHRTRFVSAQNHYSLLDRTIESEVLRSIDRAHPTSSDLTLDPKPTGNKLRDIHT